MVLFLVAVIHRIAQNAIRRAWNNCGSPAVRLPIRELTQSKCSNIFIWQTKYNESNTSLSDMKYSPQQQQQKQRKSESSDATSMDVTLSRTSTSGTEQRKTSSTSSSTTRVPVCRSPSTGMFAWMRVFRFASMLHQVGC